MSSSGFLTWVGGCFSLNAVIYAHTWKINLSVGNIAKTTGERIRTKDKGERGENVFQINIKTDMSITKTGFAFVGRGGKGLPSRVFDKITFRENFAKLDTKRFSCFAKMRDEFREFHSFVELPRLRKKWVSQNTKTKTRKTWSKNKKFNYFSFNSCEDAC